MFVIILIIFVGILAYFDIEVNTGLIFAMVIVMMVVMSIIAINTPM
ncbi:MAG: hypothetical protein ACRC0Y_13980 [Fusobacteriaceae bacterium]